MPTVPTVPPIVNPIPEYALRSEHEPNQSVTPWEYPLTVPVKWSTPASLGLRVTPNVDTPP